MKHNLMKHTLRFLMHNRTVVFMDAGGSGGGGGGGSGGGGGGGGTDITGMLPLEVTIWVVAALDEWAAH